MNLHDTIFLALAMYAVLFLFNFYLFGMQRTALLIDRECQPDAIEGMQFQLARSVLPWWLRLARLIFLGKIAILGYLLFEHQWGLTAATVVIDFLLSSILPIPYKAYARGLLRHARNYKGDREPLEAILNSRFLK